MSGDNVDPRPTDVYYLKKSDNQSIIYMSIEGIMELAKTLIDSGSTRNFIDTQYVDDRGITRIPLKNARSVIAIDGKEVEFKIWERIY